MARRCRTARPANVNAVRRQGGWLNNPRRQNIGRNLLKIPTSANEGVCAVSRRSACPSAMSPLPAAHASGFSSLMESCEPKACGVETNFVQHPREIDDAARAVVGATRNGV